MKKYEVIELAKVFIEKHDLDHGNSEVFIQGEDLYFTVEAPNHWATTISIPLEDIESMEDIENAFIERVSELDQDEEFTEMWDNVYFEPSVFMEMLQDDLKFYENVVDEIRK